MKKPLALILALAAVAIAGCRSEIVGPGSSIVRSGYDESVNTDPLPASYYQGCLKNGDLGTVSSLGSSTAATVDCKGKGNPVVLRAGSVLNFCFQPGKDATGFSTGTPKCKPKDVTGGFAAGTDLFGCLAGANLTKIEGGTPRCGKKDVIVGLSFPTPPPPCTPSISITGPTENLDGYAVVYRASDFPIDASLGGDCTGTWTYSWTYKLGDGATTTVPAPWTGSATASLTVPKWTLEKYPTAEHVYLFTVTATPPGGSGLSPVSASVHLRVLGTVPSALYSPRGFGTVPPGFTAYTSQSVDHDNALGQEKLIYRWEAQSDQSETELITPFAGINTQQIQYVWDPSSGFVTLRLTVCPSDEPYTPENPIFPPGSMPTGCGVFSDNFLILSA